MKSEARYVIINPFNEKVPNATALEKNLIEMGLQREAFSISSLGSDKTCLEFWEHDYIEAMSIITRLDLKLNRQA